MEDRIRELLYDRYIRPTEKKREHYVGVEVELPIVNITGKGTEHSVCKDAFLRAVSFFGLI